MNIPVSVALLATLLIIVLYLLSVGTIMLSILENKVEPLLHDLLNYADMEFNSLKASTNMEKVKHTRMKVMKELEDLNTTFTKVLSNLSKTLSKLYRELTSRANSTVITNLTNLKLNLGNAVREESTTS